MILPVRKTNMPDVNFPTKWQGVIFRNYGLVSAERIALTLDTDSDTIHTEAERLGIGDTAYNPEWMGRGYITVIRNNWYLLPYDQLITLLDFSEERLDFILKEEDFLGVKLGGYKPECERVRYTPLTPEELRRTERIKDRIKGLSSNGKAFEFFTRPPTSAHPASFATARGTSFIHGYITPCGDAFDIDSREYLPDSLLEMYRDVGIGGIWLHGVLSSLSPYPFDPELSRDYKRKRQNLAGLIDRAAKYGIKIYLYFNEPRYISTDKAEKFSHLTGLTTGTGASLCLSHREVRDYLREAIRDLVSECHLGGIFTITMSENQTHCRYRTHTNCPHCKNTPPEELVALVNNLILEGVEQACTDTEVIANIWGWGEYQGWTREQTHRGISLLDPRISVLAVSEFDLPIEKGGVKNRIIDYSISNPGPSPVTADNLSYAASLGHKVYAKVQVNNSWECSAVPYLPVFDLVGEHLGGLYSIGVSNFMLSWTLGGYPSPTLDYISSYSASSSIDSWYRSYYGKDAETVHDAVRHFCRGFREYPFSCDHMYFSPQNLGPANMWSIKRDEKESCMVGYAFDDAEKWLEKYPYDVFMRQTEKLLDEWRRGLDILRSIDDATESTAELLLFAEVAYIHFESDLLHTEYAVLKRDIRKNKARLAELADLSSSAAEKLLALSVQDGRVGYEASNHYYYTPNLLKEKIINLEKFKECLGVLK